MGTIRAILQFLGLIFSYLKYAKPIPRKSLSCEFIDRDYPIPWFFRSRLNEEIKVTYRGNLITNIFFETARIKNCGMAMVSEEDMEEPIEFVFDRNTDILIEPAIFNRKPSKIKVYCELKTDPETKKRNRVELKFNFLNSGDSFDIQFACTGKSETYSINSHLRGVKDGIKIISQDEVYAKSNLMAFLKGAWLLIPFLIIFAIGIIINKIFNIDVGKYIILAVIFFVYGAAILLVVHQIMLLWKLYKYRKKGTQNI